MVEHTRTQYSGGVPGPGAVEDEPAAAQASVALADGLTLFQTVAAPAGSSSPTMNPLVPAVGAGVSDGLRWALRLPDGQFVDVHLETAVIDELAAALQGVSAWPPHRADVRSAFQQAGYLAVADDDTGPLRGRRVWVVGTGRIADAVVETVREVGARVEQHGVDVIADADAQLPEAVVAVSDDAADPHWLAGDTLPARGVAWQRLYVEGAQAFLEPLAVEAGDVTHAHVRARRLAASYAPQHLTDYWHGQRLRNTRLALDRSTAQLLAALAVRDLRAWAGDARAGSFGPLRRRLQVIDLGRLDISEHPVLPVPPSELHPQPTVTPDQTEAPGPGTGAPRTSAAAGV